MLKFSTWAFLALTKNCQSTVFQSSKDIKRKIPIGKRLSPCGIDNFVSFKCDHFHSLKYLSYDRSHVEEKERKVYIGPIMSHIKDLNRHL